MQAKHRNDILLITLCLALCLTGFLLLQFLSTGGHSVVVEQDGTTVGVYALTDAVSVPLHSADGGYNLLVIENGTAALHDCTCPDRLCEKQGVIRRSGQSIICLPHRLCIRITGEDAPDLVIR